MVLSLGIDVGSRKLSICILDKPTHGIPSSEQLQDITIVDWKTIDLIRPTCSFDGCHFDAHIAFPNQFTNPCLCFCKKHSKRFKLTGNIIRKYHSKNLPQGLLARRVYNCVSEFQKYKIDSISIELQPPNNKSMQRISHYIFMALYTYSGSTLDKYRNYKRATFKLSHFGKHGLDPRPRPTTYSERKDRAKIYVAWYLEQMNLDTKDKITADDADSFLYALYS